MKLYIYMYVRISIYTNFGSIVFAQSFALTGQHRLHQYRSNTSCHHTRHLLHFHKLCHGGMRHRPHAEKVPFWCLREITVVRYAILYKLTSYLINYELNKWSSTTHNLHHIYSYNTTFITINIKIHIHAWSLQYPMRHEILYNVHQFLQFSTIFQNYSTNILIYSTIFLYSTTFLIYSSISTILYNSYI